MRPVGTRGVEKLASDVGQDPAPDPCLSYLPTPTATQPSSTDLTDSVQIDWDQHRSLSATTAGERHSSQTTALARPTRALREPTWL
jgi:hypothetical protein